MTRQIQIRTLALAATLLAPMVLWIAPAQWVEGGPTICLYRNLLGVHCPGCGMTRAFYHMAHADFAAAIGYNKLVVIAFPLAVAIWGVWIKRQLVALRGLFPAGAVRTRKGDPR